MPCAQAAPSFGRRTSCTTPRCVVTMPRKTHPSEAAACARRDARLSTPGGKRRQTNDCNRLVIRAEGHHASQINGYSRVCCRNGGLIEPFIRDVLGDAAPYAERRN